MLKFLGKWSILALSLTTSSWGMDLTNESIADTPKRVYNLKFTHESHNWLKENHPNYKHIHKLNTVQETLPKIVDMRKDCSPVFNQGNLGSCTANAGCGLVEFDLLKQNLYDGHMSRLFQYFNERDMDGTVDDDSGASIADIVKVLSTKGVCHESLWPYSDDSTTFKKKPSDACYQEALKYVDLDNAKVASVEQDEYTIKSLLANSKPIVFGFNVYSSFESQKVAQTGKMTMPGKHEQCMGGHAVMLVGYDDNKQKFIVRNSWGTGWGKEGYFMMPYKYLLDSHLASDFWTVSKIGPKS